ncbi:MAG TPA: hypothetical protein ENK18_23115 [Deltaproteobacteria bacterium]|nr:hypothetical protein [Deltaproteobacteria bacterium]
MISLLLACTPGPPQLPPGTWLAGDLHVHSSVGSNDTDGLGTPDVLPGALEAAGLDFVFITDHSNSAGSMGCPTGDVEDCPNQGPELSGLPWPDNAWAAIEISPIHELPQSAEPTGHVSCLPLDGVSFPGLDHFEDRPPGTVTGGDAVAQCKEHGGFAIVNHPYAAVPWIEYDWTSEDFDALEVYNGGTRFDPSDAESIAAWEDRIAQGRAIVPIGASDCHRWGTVAPGDLLNPALGWPTTHAHVRGDERPLDAIVAGRVVISEPGTTLSLIVWGETAAAGPGETVTGPATASVEASTTSPGLQLQLKRAGGEILASAPMQGTTSLELELEPGIAVYARVWPKDPDTPAQTGGVALTHVVWIE